MKLLEEDDIVEVTTSKSGYKGPGRLVSQAFGSNWLVEKLNCELDTNRIIIVSALHLTKSSESGVERGKKRDKEKGKRKG